MISDTHGRHGSLVVPDGDLLIHAGDATGQGRASEVQAFDRWLGTLPHPHKVVIAGNHDFFFQDVPSARQTMKNAVYLEDEEVQIGGLRIYGSPWQPEFFDWAFNLPRGPELRTKWQAVPSGVDILVTHGPPFGILDTVERGERVGCEDLLDEIVNRIRPRLHVFGHIHESYGRVERHGATFVNASSCNLDYRPTNPPVVLDLQPVSPT